MVSNSPRQLLKKCSVGKGSTCTAANFIGRKQDKAGRWRKATVPDYVNDQRQAYAIDERMKKLGQSERYIKELA